MDGADLTPTPTSSAAMMGASSTLNVHVPRPTLGFPLGTALLLLVIFSLSGVFSCCYHWDKLRSLRHRHSSSSSTTTQLPTTTTAAASSQHQPHTSTPLSPSKVNFKQQDLKQESEQSLPVIMPGDRYPKFMAWPCPCKLPTPSGTTTMIAVEVVLIPSIP